MSLTKRLLQEELEREYLTTDESVCAKCFYDKGIKQFIREHLKAKSCVICGRTCKRNIAAPADQLLEFFLEKIHDHFQSADGNAPRDPETGEFTVSTWDKYDLLNDKFPDVGEHAAIEWLDRRLKDIGPLCRMNWQAMSQDEALSLCWEGFCEAVKHKTRFLFFSKEKSTNHEEAFHLRPEELLDKLGDLITTMGLVRDLPIATRISRARGHGLKVVLDEPLDLGPPPLKNAKTAGRMNAPGIVVLYASFDKETALQEATGEYPAYTVAEFQLLSTLRVVDLTRIPRVPSIFEDGPREIISFLNDFATNIASPFDPDLEVHIEYSPSQVVSEYLRHRFVDTKGVVHGVLYASAKTLEGINAALFIESDEIEGVPSEWGKPKQPLLRLTKIENFVAKRAFTRNTF